MKPGDDSSRPAFPVLVPVVLLTAIALWIRLRALPGTWGADALTYFEASRSQDSASTDPRTDRWLAVALVRTALRIGGWTPASASVPGVMFSAAVVPVLWFALRRPLGDALALLPCAMWTFLGLDVERVVEISSDVLLALPAALAVWGLDAASRRAGRQAVPLAAAGVALGVGATLKETMLLAAAGFTVGAFCVGPGTRRWKNAAALALPALAVFGAGLLVVNPGRISNASQYMAMDPAFVPASGHAFLRRITIEIPEVLLTATQAFGLALVVAIPLLVRLPFRAVRGDPLAAATLAGFAAFDVAPISLRTWALLPASRPRYLLCLMPALFAALADALRVRVVSRAERWVSLLAAVAAMRFAGASPWTMLLVPPGLVLTAWPALPAPVAAMIAERARIGFAAGVLLAATVAWTDLPSHPSSFEWTIAAATAALASAPWLVGRDRASPAPYFAAGAATVLAVAMACSRFVPDAGWTAWSELPPAGRVFADRIAGRRLCVAAVSQGADRSRVILLEPGTGPPRDLVPGDRVLAIETGAPGDATTLARLCRLSSSGLRELPVKLGETVLFAPAPR